MSSIYAKETKVPASRTQDEIIKTLRKYGASGFVFGEAHGQALVMFEMRQRRIKFILPLPKDTVSKQGQQGVRTRWRCLLLSIKAKLESVQSGIAYFDDEFMANIVMPNGKTVSENIGTQIAGSCQSGTMQPLLGPAPTPS